MARAESRAVAEVADAPGRLQIFQSSRGEQLLEDLLRSSKTGDRTRG